MNHSYLTLISKDLYDILDNVFITMTDREMLEWISKKGAVVALISLVPLCFLIGTLYGVSWDTEDIMNREDNYRDIMWLCIGVFIISIIVMLFAEGKLDELMDLEKAIELIGKEGYEIKEKET